MKQQLFCKLAITASVLGLLVNSSFSQTLTFSSQTAPSTNNNFVAAADVNLDDIIDLVTAGSPDGVTGQVSILLGHGDGSFISLGTVSLPSKPDGLALADVNVDGQTDFVITTNLGSSAGAILVYTNNGSGSFALRNAINLPFQPSGLAVADVNNDGMPDIAVAGFTNSVAGTAFLNVYTNNGSGFGLFFTANTGQTPVSLAAADVNNDGKIDLITADSLASTLWVYTNNGAGFGPFASLPTGSTPSTVVAADVNHDGKVDLITANTGGTPAVIVFTNNGNGFGAFSSNAVAGNPVSIAAADLYHRDLLDLVCVNSSGGNLLVLTNNGTGFGSNTVVAAGSGPNHVVAADFNGDGRLDLATANASDFAQVFSNATASAFTFLGYVTNTISGGPVDRPASVAAADVNNDGKMDMIIASTNDFLRVLLNLGNGVFASSYTAPSSGNKFVAAADVNNDGKVDLVAIGSPDGTTGLVTVLTNNGSGLFFSNSAISLPVEPQYLALADMNGDGKMDFVITTNLGFSAGAVLVYTNKGNGTFSLRNVINLPFQPGGLAVADVNADGKADIGVAGLTNAAAGSAFARVYTNNGTGFGLFSSANQGTDPVWVTFADLSHIGRKDMVVLDAVQDQLEIYLNVKTNFTTSFFGVPTSTSPTSMATADVNNDGQADLVVVNSGGTPKLQIYEGAGPVGLSYGPPVAVGANPNQVIVADLDNIGYLSLISADFGATNLEVYGPLYVNLAIQPPPVLNISVMGANLLFTWISYNPNFTLYTNSNLSVPLVEMDGLNIQSANLTNWSVTIPVPTTSPMFFRLGPETQ